MARQISDELLVHFDRVVLTMRDAIIDVSAEVRAEMAANNKHSDAAVSLYEVFSGLYDDACDARAAAHPWKARRAARAFAHDGFPTSRGGALVMSLGMSVADDIEVRALRRFAAIAGLSDDEVFAAQHAARNQDRGRAW